MLDQIRDKLFQKYKPQENKGLFFSGLDDKGALIFSTGVLTTDRSLEKILDSIYFGIIDKQYKGKNINVLLVDVVLNVTEGTPEQIIGTSPKEYGYCMISEIDGKSGVMLPDVSGVADAKNALYLIKTKNNMEGKVKLYKFKTDRITIRI